MERTGSGDGRLKEPLLGKRKMMAMDQDMGSGMDELLVALGYEVRSSDMADLAQKLELLDRAMGNSSIQEHSLLSHLASDAVHYNPTDLSRWVENILSDLNDPNPTALVVSPIDASSWSGSDRRSRGSKRMRSSSSRSSSSAASPALPMVMADSDHEPGIRLVHALIACAEAIQQEDYTSADAVLKQIPFLASFQRGAMRKVAVYFAEALARRIYRAHPGEDHPLDPAFSGALQMHFYETCPHLKFAHFTANQAILEAFAGHRRVHVIDFGVKHGIMQWPALMQALALRPGGPPSLRLTGIASPEAESSESLHQLGSKLAQLAGAIRVDFEFRGLIASSLAGVELDVGAEAIAVNSVFELHRLLAIPGAVEEVLDAARSLRPRIVTVVEQEASHNAGGFVERFAEALHYYSTLFDSMDGGGGGGAAEGSPEKAMAEAFVGRQICNVVAREGAERTERHETLERWRERMGRAGFEPVSLGSNAFKQARMLLALFGGGDGYGVEEREGCLTLGWHNRALIAASAWRVAAPATV